MKKKLFYYNIRNFLIYSSFSKFLSMNNEKSRAFFLLMNHFKFKPGNVLKEFYYVCI